MSRKIIYTAGPISTQSMNARWGFFMTARTMAQKIWASGHVAICPQMNTMMMDDPCVPAENFYKGDEEIIRRCVDGMVMLPGWRLSKGSITERDLAQSLNLRLFYYDEIDRLWDFLKAENLAAERE